MKKWILGLLTLMLVFSGLTACGTGQNEIATMLPTEETQPSDGTCTVSSIDELLSALSSNRVIELKEGEYRLDRARDYGQDSDNPAYYWVDRGDGYQLTLNHLHDLVIRGADRETTSLVTSSLFSDILSLESCKRITLEGFTAGHIEGAGPCSGNVMGLSDCEHILMNRMGLYGCGIVGVNALACRDLMVTDTDIYDCSLYGIQAMESQGIHMEGCNFYTIGTKQDPAMAVFSLGSCSGVTIENCSISENYTSMLLTLGYDEDILLKNTEFRANKITAYAFQFTECQPVFDGCSFEGNDLQRWYESISDMAVNERNEVIGNDQLPPTAALQPQDLPIQVTVEANNMDEFLQSIGPNRDIVLNCELLDLCTASDYGSGSSPYYWWEETYDGFQLVIGDVTNMTIRGSGEDFHAHEISAAPQYANVLSFRSCSDILVTGFTAGHKEQPGFCTGGVLNFKDCMRIRVDRCGLYGCGILGVEAEFCSDLSVTGCDIYDCSFGGIQLWNITGAQVEGNQFWDLGGPALMTQNCDELKTDTEPNIYPMQEPLN